MDAGAAAAAATLRSSRQRSASGMSRSSWPPSATSRHSSAIPCGRRSPARSIEVAFHEGDFVKQGQLLFTIDRRPFEAALAQAEANLTRDKALLAQAEAQLSRDAANAEYQQLTARTPGAADRARHHLEGSGGAGARRRRRHRRRRSRPTSATIESARAQLVAQQAAVDERAACSSATRRSGRRSTGSTGNLAVKVGSLVTANQTELMTIAQREPVYVTFAVPAIHLADHQAAHGRRRRCRSPRRRRTATPQPAHRRAHLRRQRRRHRRPTRSS